MMVLDMFLKYKEIEAVSLLRDNNLIVGFCALIMLMAGSVYFSESSMHSSIGSEMVQFSKLSNADIDNIIAVKAKMQAARIQANLSI